MIWKNSFLALVITLTSSQISVGKTVEFDDLPQLIQNQNLGIQGNQKFTDAAKSKTNHLGRSFLPQIQAYGGGEIFQTLNQPKKSQPTAGIEGKINLLEGGRDAIEESIRKNTAKLKNTETQQKYFTELYRARELFVEILFFKEIQSFHKEAFQRNQRNINLVKQRIDAGLTTQTDKIDFEIEQNNLQQELALIDEELEHSFEDLQTILGFSLDKNINIKGKLDHQHHDPIFKAKFEPESHIEIALLENISKDLALRKKKENLWWAPSLDIYSGYHLYSFRKKEETSIAHRDEFVAGVKLKMNLFDGLKSQNQAKSLKLKQKGIDLLSQQKKKEVEVHFRELKHTLQVRHDLTHQADEAVVQTKTFLELTQEEYERGIKNSSDLLNASQRILTQKKRAAQIRKDFLMIKNEMMTFLGK